MIVNYLKVTWRNLHKSLFFSFINISGLAVGMAVMPQIGLWIYDGLMYDHHHAHYDGLARVIVHHNSKQPLSIL